MAAINAHFGNEEILILIEKVKNRPVLYNHYLKNKKNQKKPTELWDEIGAEMNRLGTYMPNDHGK